MKQRFLLCVDNTGYEASLELRKLYENLPDKEAERHGQLRIIDESGEDYLYPAKYFECIEEKRVADLMMEGYHQMGAENLRLSEEFLRSEKGSFSAWKASETLEILSDEEAVGQLQRSISAVKEGKTVPWQEAKEKLGI